MGYTNVAHYPEGKQGWMEAGELRPEETHRSRIPGAAWQLIRQPALTLTRIIVGKQMGSARVPASPQPVAQLQTYPRIALDVADVSRLRPVLCDQPELVPDAPIANWRASWLPGIPPFRFE